LVCFDDALRFLVGVDQHGVVGDIGGDPDILQNKAAAGGAWRRNPANHYPVPAAGAARVFRGGAAPVAGAAPEACVGSALNEASGLGSDEEVEMPEPGEIWLVALSRLPLAVRPVSISLKQVP